MKQVLVWLCILVSTYAYSQNKKTEKIEREGILLYRLEKGSWYGTDDMLERFASKKDSIGGYLSYETNAHTITTIFFNRYNYDKILARYEFDSLTKPVPRKIDSINTVATATEKRLITIRQDAAKRAFANEDSFFKFYKNTALNFIPVIDKDGSRVYVVTGPKIPNVVLLGNDYKLDYNKKDEFVDKMKIHNSIIQLPYKSENKDEPIVTTYHSHVVTDYISSTDICTLLLYKDFLQWDEHIVMSEKEVSIFDLEKESLFAIKRKAWDKINSQKNNDK